MAENQFLAEALQQHEANWNGWDLERTQASQPYGYSDLNTKAYAHNSQLAGAGYNYTTNKDGTINHLAGKSVEANNARIAAGKKTDAVTSAWNSWFTPNGENYRNSIGQTYTDSEGNEHKVTDYLRSYALSNPITEAGSRLQMITDFDNNTGTWRTTSLSKVSQSDLDNGNWMYTYDHTNEDGGIDKGFNTLYSDSEREINFKINDANETIRASLREHPSIATLMEQDTTNKNYIDRFQAAQQKLIDAYSTISLIGKKDSDGFYTAQQMTDAFNLLNMAGTLPDRKEVETFWNWYSSIDGDGYKEWRNSRPDNVMLRLSTMSEDAQYQEYLNSPEYQSQKINVFYNGMVNDPFICLPSDKQFESMVKSGAIETSDSWVKVTNDNSDLTMPDERSYVDYSYAYNDYKNAVITSYYPDYWKQVLTGSDNADLVALLHEHGLIKSVDGIDGGLGEDFSGITINSLNELLDSISRKVYTYATDHDAYKWDLPEGWSVRYNQLGDPIYVSPEGKESLSVPPELRRSEIDINGKYATLAKLDALVKSVGTTDLSGWSNFVLWADDIKWNTDKYITNMVSGIEHLQSMMFDVTPESIQAEIDYGNAHTKQLQYVMQLEREVATVGDWVFDITENLETMLLDRLTPSSLGAMAFRVFGEQCTEYTDENGSVNYLQALLRTAAEVGGERIFSGFAYGKGLFDLTRIIPNIVMRTGAGWLANFGTRLTIEMLEEGLEEWVTNGFNIAFDKILQKNGRLSGEATEWDWGQAWYEFAIAAACAGISGGGNLIVHGNYAYKASAWSPQNTNEAMSTILHANTNTEDGKQMYAKSILFLTEEYENLDVEQRCTLASKAGLEVDFMDMIDSTAESIKVNMSYEIEQKIGKQNTDAKSKTNVNTVDATEMAKSFVEQLTPVINGLYGETSVANNLLKGLEISYLQEAVGEEGNVLTEEGRAITEQQAQKAVGAVMSTLSLRFINANLIGDVAPEYLTNADFSIYQMINQKDPAKVRSAIAQRLDAINAREDSLLAHDKERASHARVGAEVREAELNTNDIRIKEQTEEKITVETVSGVLSYLDNAKLKGYIFRSLKSNPDGSIELTYEKATDQTEGTDIDGYLNSIAEARKSESIPDVDLKKQSIYNMLSSYKATDVHQNIVLGIYSKLKAIYTMQADAESGGVNARTTLNTEAFQMAFFNECDKQGFTKARALTALNQAFTSMLQSAENDTQRAKIIKDIASMRSAFAEEFKAAYQKNIANEHFFEEVDNAVAEYTKDVNEGTIETERIILSKAQIIAASEELDTLLKANEDGNLTEADYERVKEIYTGSAAIEVNSDTLFSLASVANDFINSKVNAREYIRALKEISNYTRAKGNSCVLDSFPALKERIDSFLEKYGDVDYATMDENQSDEFYELMVDMNRCIVDSEQFVVDTPQYRDVQNLEKVVDNANGAEYFKLANDFKNADMAIMELLGYNEESKFIHEMYYEFYSTKYARIAQALTPMLYDEGTKTAYAKAKEIKIEYRGRTYTLAELTDLYCKLNAHENALDSGNGIKIKTGKNTSEYILKPDTKILDYVKNSKYRTMTSEIKEAMAERTKLRNDMVKELESQLSNYEEFKVIRANNRYVFGTVLSDVNRARRAVFGRVLKLNPEYYPMDVEHTDYTDTSRDNRTRHRTDTRHNLGSYVNNGQDILVRGVDETILDYVKTTEEHVWNNQAADQLQKIVEYKTKAGNFLVETKQYRQLIERLRYGEENKDSAISKALGKVSSKWANAHLGMNISATAKQFPSANVGKTISKTQSFVGSKYTKIAKEIMEMSKYTVEGMSPDLIAVLGTLNMRNKIGSYYDMDSAINWMANLPWADTKAVTKMDLKVLASTIKTVRENFNASHGTEISIEEADKILTGKIENNDLTNTQREFLKEFIEAAQANITMANLVQPTSDIMMSNNLGNFKFLFPYMGQRIQYFNKFMEAYTNYKTASSDLKAEARENLVRLAGTYTAQSFIMASISTIFNMLKPNSRKKYWEEDGSFDWSHLGEYFGAQFCSSFFSIVPVIGPIFSSLINAKLFHDDYAMDNAIQSNMFNWALDDGKNIWSMISEGKFNKTNLASLFNLITIVTGVPINNLITIADVSASVGTHVYDMFTGDDTFKRQESITAMFADAINQIVKGGNLSDVQLKFIDNQLEKVIENENFIKIAESNPDIFANTSDYVINWFEEHTTIGEDGKEDKPSLGNKGTYITLLNDMKEAGIITDNDVAALVESYNSIYSEKITAENLANRAYTTAGKQWLGDDDEFSKAETIAFDAGVPSRDDWVSMYTEAGFTNDEGAFHVTKEITANAIENGFVDANNYEQYGLTDEQFQSGLSEWYMIDAFNTAGMSLYAHMYDKNGDGQLSSGELNDMKGNKTATGADLYETFLSLNPNIANIQSTSNPTQASEVKAAQKEIQQGFKDRTEAAKEGQKAIKNSFDANGNGSISQEELSTITAEQCAEMSDEELYYLYNEKVKSASAKSIKNNAGMTNIQNEWLKRVEKIGEPSYELPTLYTPSFSSSSFNRSTDIGFKPVTFDELF